MLRTTTLLVILAWSAAAPRDLGAQAPVTPRPSRFSLELTLGVQGARSDGTYRQDGYYSKAGDLLLAARVGRALGGFLVVGGGAAAPLEARVTSAICVLAPDGGCIPPFPVLVMLTAHFGWENAHATRRVLVGPAWVDSDVGSGSLGAQLRFEGAIPVSPRWAVVAGARATAVPDHNADRFGALAAGIGLRVR